VERSNALRREQRVVALLAMFGFSLSLAACGSAEDTTSALSPVTAGTRPATYSTCAAAKFTAPANMHLVDLELPNLGSGMLGHHDVYDAPPEKLEISIGLDVLGAYEDLDFETTKEQVAGTEVDFSAAGAFGTDDRLLILTWVQPGVDGVCAQRSIVGTNVGRSVLLDVARQILGDS
jgi:hypothetical protein